MHVEVAYALQTLGRLALQRGDSAEAEADYTKDVAILREMQDDENLPKALCLLGDSQMRQKSYKQAEDAYREAVALFPRAPSDTTADRAQANRKLGELLLLQKRYTEAESPLLASYSVFSAKPTSYFDDLLATRRDLVQDYRALKKPVKPEYLQAHDRR
jgi:tetratricopeptide (TPR) repeat protein